MRRLLDGIYLATGVLSALSIMAIVLLILTQVGGRMLSVHVPGSDDLVAWLTAGTIFLGLPYAMVKGAHIRVELLIGQLPAPVAKKLEFVVLAGAIVLVGWAAQYATGMVLDSYRYHELAMGQLPLPMWIPQLSLAIGIDVLLLALVDCFVVMCRGGVPLYAQAHIEETVQLNE